MAENSKKRGLTSSVPFFSENDDDPLLRQIFATYDRFSLILTRFFTKELSIRPEAELQTVEKTPLSLLYRFHSSFSVERPRSPQVDEGRRGMKREKWSVGDIKPLEPSHRHLFQIDLDGVESPVFIEMEGPFLFAAVDRILGSERFAPDHETESFTEIDRKLAELFVHRLAELLAGFSRIDRDGESTSTGSVTWVDEIPLSEETSDGDYYLLTWNIACGGGIFSLVLYLPSDVATRPFAPRTSGVSPFGPNETDRNGAAGENDLSRYIEARKNEKSRPVPFAAGQTVADPGLITGSVHVSDPACAADAACALSSAHLAGTKSIHRGDAEGSTEIRILVGTLEITPDDLTEMKPGDLLTTDIPATAPFRIDLDGVVLFYGRPGEYRGESAVEILADMKKD